jgi:hypothetical protein
MQYWNLRCANESAAFWTKKVSTEIFKPSVRSLSMRIVNALNRHWNGRKWFTHSDHNPMNVSKYGAE